jgi:hypothetical protein
MCKLDPEAPVAVFVDHRAPQLAIGEIPKRLGTSRFSPSSAVHDPTCSISRAGAPSEFAASSLDGSAAALCDGRFDKSNVSDGPHVLAVTATHGVNTSKPFELQFVVGDRPVG